MREGKGDVAAKAAIPRAARTSSGAFVCDQLEPQVALVRLFAS